MASIRRVLGEAGGAPVVERPGAGDIEIEAVFELGVVHVVKTLWNQLGIAAAFSARTAGKKLKAPHVGLLLAVTMQRLEWPGSKLDCHERWLERVWLPATQDLALGQLYRALDLLAEHSDAIEEAVFWNSVDLFKLDVDLVFYDATTAWFECDEADVANREWRGLTFDPLRQRGHSKESQDNHPQEANDPSLEQRVSGDARGDPQIVIALAVNRASAAGWPRSLRA